MSFWQRYTALSRRTRVIIGLGTMAYCYFALYAVDTAEDAFGFKPTEEDKKRWAAAMPKIVALDGLPERPKGDRNRDQK